MQKLIELPGSHHSCFATIVRNSENLKYINQVFLFRISLILDCPHLLKQTVDMSNHTSASWAFDIRVHLCYILETEEINFRAKLKDLQDNYINKDNEFSIQSLRTSD
jgi:hypothetical protein